MQETEPTQGGLIQSFCGEIFACDKVPSDAETAGPGTTSGEPQAGKTPDVLPLRVSPPRSEVKNQEPESDSPCPSPSSDNSRQCDLGQSFSALSSTSETRDERIYLWHLGKIKYNHHLH